MQALIQSHRTSRVGRLGHFCNMDIVLFWLHIRGFKPLLLFYFRVEENFAGGKFRELPFGVDIIFAGGKFRAKSKFAKIAKIYSTRKIGVIQYSRIERPTSGSGRGQKSYNNQQCEKNEMFLSRAY